MMRFLKEFRDESGQGTVAMARASHVSGGVEYVQSESPDYREGSGTISVYVPFRYQTVCAPSSVTLGAVTLYNNNNVSHTIVATSIVAGCAYGCCAKVDVTLASNNEFSIYAALTAYV